MPIKVISDLVERNIYSKPPLSVSCLYLLNDKRLLIVTKELTIIIMTQDLKMVQFEIKTDGWVSCIAELPNNDIIAPNRRGTIQIFKLNKSSSKQIKVFKGHSADILSVIILDKSKFATSSYDLFIKIWQSTHPYNLIVTLEGHKVNVYSLIKIKHTNYFASGSKDMTVRFWNNISYETNIVQNIECGYKGSLFDLENKKIIAANISKEICRLYVINSETFNIELKINLTPNLHNVNDGWRGIFSFIHIDETSFLCGTPNV